MSFAIQSKLCDDVLGVILSFKGHKTKKILAQEKMINQLKRSQNYFNSYVEYLPAYYKGYEMTAFHHFSYHYNTFMKRLDKANGW